MIYNSRIYNYGGVSKTVLDGGYKHYCFKIRSVRGSHPCCYIQIPKDHPWFKKTECEVDLDVHGGLTYSGDLNEEGTWWIGWDYAHPGDFLCTKFKVSSLGELEIVYNFDDLIEDIYKAIDELIEKTSEEKTNGGMFSLFKKRYPSVKVTDYRPLSTETEGKRGINIYTENGDIISYFPKESK